MIFFYIFMSRNVIFHLDLYSIIEYNNERN